MAENQDDNREEKVVKKKATVGAWWKSTTAEVVLSTEASNETEKRPTKKSSSRAKRPSQDAVQSNSLPVLIEESSVGGKALDGERESEEKPRVPQAKRKRPPRKRQAKVTTEEQSDTSAQGDIETESDSSLPVVEKSTKDDEDGKGGERRKAKGSRGRRGRRGGKKTVLPEASSSVTTDDTDFDGDVPGYQGDSERHQVAGAYDDERNDGSRFDDVYDDEEGEDEPEEEVAKEEVKRVCKLLINAEEPEECRLALLEDGRLESIHVSTISRTQTKNNIYKAKIVAIEPSLQAAFVDYGTEKNGFLPFSEIHPEYYREDLSADVRHFVETHQWKKLSIIDVIEKGQEILAQVVKEEVGKKGANMTTYLSIPGRCVVLMPGSDSSGISRRISGEEKRSQLRGAMNSIDLPEGIGWIVRTASVDINEEVLARDVKYLMHLWEDIKKKGQELKGVGLVYEDQESVLRFLREHFDPSIEEILVDDRTALEQVKAFVEMLPEKQRNVKVRLHQGARPIFNQYSVEDQIESIYQPQVSLPSGGSIVINPTEALVAIDVNSGSTSRGKNFEASIFQANMEAAAELARQLRLRDLGGLIVVDFIDMRNRKHIMAVEKKVKDSMKKDKAKVDFSRISKFGLLQISRQKLGAPIEAGNYRRCEHCKGRGTVRSVETLSLYYLRRIQTGASRKGVGQIECHFPIDVGSYLLNNKRSELHEMEKRYGVEIVIVARPDMKPMDNELLFHKAEKEAQEKKQA